MATGGQVAVTKCDICAENIGTLFCYACNHYLCQSCEKFHLKFPSTKHHKVVNSQGIDKLVANNKHVCEDHKQDYGLFCTTCDGLICTLCATSEHNGHNFKALSNVVTEARASVEENILLLKQKKKSILTLTEDIRLKNLKKIDDDLELYSQQVKKDSKSLSQLVDSVTSIYITRVTDHYQLQRKQIEKTLSELERLRNDLSSLLGRCEQILSVEHDVTFILSQKSLAKELSEINDIPKIDELELVEKFSQKHFAESMIENIQKHYKLKGKEELKIKVSALEAEITAFKANVKPLLPLTGQEEKLSVEGNKLIMAKESLERSKNEMQELEWKYAQLIEENDIMAELFQAETEMWAEAEESRARMAAKNQELENILHDLELRIKEEDDKCNQLIDERKKIQQTVADLEEKLEEEKRVRHKLYLEKVSADSKIKTLQEDLTKQDDRNKKLEKEKQFLEERLANSAYRGDGKI